MRARNNRSNHIDDRTFQPMLTPTNQAYPGLSSSSAQRSSVISGACNSFETHLHSAGNEVECYKTASFNIILYFLTCLTLLHEKQLKIRTKNKYKTIRSLVRWIMCISILSTDIQIIPIQSNP